MNYSFYRLDPVFRRRLRYTEASLYTQRDTPMFTCAKAPIDAIVAQLANMD
jgi:chlorite dismutase